MGTLEKLLTNNTFMVAVGGAIGVVINQLGSYLGKKLDARVRVKEQNNDLAPLYLDHVKELMNRQEQQIEQLNKKVTRLTNELSKKQESVLLLESDVRNMKTDLEEKEEQIQELQGQLNGFEAKYKGEM